MCFTVSGLSSSSMILLVWLSCKTFVNNARSLSYVAGGGGYGLLENCPYRQLRRMQIVGTQYSDGLSIRDP